MANTKPLRNAANFTFRLSPAEKEAAERLAGLRAQEAAKAGFEPDASLGAWLRFMIRREAAAAGFAVPMDAAPPEPPPAPKRRKGARK